MVVHLLSPDNRYDTLYLSNYALLRVKDELTRLDGVGDVQVFGAGQFSMRIWLDPEKIASRNLTATDVVQALRDQNVQVAAGQLGAPPLAGTTEFQIAINAKGRLSSEEDFRNVIIKTGAAGQVTRLKDVARVELGADTYVLRFRSSSARGAMRLPSPSMSAPRCRSSSAASRPASTTRSSTIRPSSCAAPFTPWFTR
jgi:multidrug efflux pump